MKLNHKAFTLIELIIVIAIVGLISAAVFVSVDPAKRIGDTKDAIRVSDVVAIEKAIQKAIAEGKSVPVTMSALTEDTPYMLVIAGGVTTSVSNCNTLDLAISRIDLAAEFQSYLGSNIPVDDDAVDDDTGYYIKRKSSSFFINSCNAYEDEFVSPSTCGNGILEGPEVCDSNFTTACTVDGNYFEGGYVGTGVCTPEVKNGCNNTCDACLLGDSCRAGGPS